MKDLLNNYFDKLRDYENGKKIYGDIGDSGNGIFKIKIDGKIYNVIASNGNGWEHVSVSNDKHIPSWNVMCKIKDLFFYENETVIQYHPAKTNYINNHPNCLHLWRCINEQIPTPPTYMIGIK